MESINLSRVRSSSALIGHRHHLVDQNFVGVSTSVRILLKLIHDYKEAFLKDNDGKRDKRISEMVLIIEEVKSQIQKSHSHGKKKAELRRCNTDLRRNVPSDKKMSVPITDEKAMLTREVNANMVVQKNLESMCSSIGKEKDIIAKELARTVQQLRGMEEHVNDLQAQNEMLMCKVQVCVAEHRVKKSNVPDIRGNIEAFQKRNKELTEQLLKSYDVCRSLKRKLKQYQDIKNGADARMEEMGHRVRAGLGRIRSFKEMVIQNDDEKQIDLEHEISALEHMFKCFDFEIAKHAKNKKRSMDCNNNRGNAEKSFFLG